MSGFFDVLKVYWQSSRRYKWLLFLIVILIGLAATIDVVTPIYYKKFIDILAKSSPVVASLPELIKILIFIFFLNFIQWCSWRWSTFANNFFQIKVMADLKQNSFDYLIGHSYNFFVNHFGGSLVQRVNRLSRSFERFSDSIYFSFWPLTIKVIGFFVVLFLFNKTVALIFVSWIIIFLFFNVLFSAWKLKYDIRRAEGDSLITATIADAITNHTNVELFSGYSREKKLLESVNDKWFRLTKFTWDLTSIVEAVQGFLIIIVQFLLFYFALRYWQKGLLTIGTFVLIQNYVFQLIGHLWEFGRVVRNVYESNADAKEMVDILNTPYEIKDVENATSLIVKKGEVTFQGVSFSFNDSREVLKNINLTIKAGEKVALIGPSGAGKSTIVKLLLRLYNTELGQILIDGQDTQKVTQESLRASLGLVPQDPILFHRTLLENIRYGKMDATNEEVYRVSSLAHCDEFIKNFLSKYETFVGERGIKLSGGERQRVAIARAMLKNAPILILDEATSSLDSHSEALIQGALEKLMGNKTVIVIAHRLSTIKKMDRIIVVDKGQIIEQGSHDELLANPDSLYTKLWTIQAGGFIP